MNDVQNGFRRDVQGLRALAVGLVAVGHARLGFFPGGFVGVDVFFVISGYLITGLLVAEAGGGAVSLLGFYARRARRILPAATVVILSTVVASMVLLDAIAARSVVKDALWSTFFAANVKFARDGTDYFSSGNAVSPLQHYWSLAVEEQFYLVWPLLVLGLALLARASGARTVARRRARVRRLAVPLLLLVVAVSLTWSVIATHQASAGSAQAAYFSFSARAWELAIGALAACLAPRLTRLPAELLGGLSWIGLGGIVAAALLYDDQTPFPGTAALLPVLGAALLLVGGLRPSRIGPQPLLTLAPVRAVGDWSYSFYLWHWPALILAGSVWGRPSGWYGLAVLAVALGLSALTYHYVENPFRRARVLSATRLRGVLLYPAVLAMTIPLLGVADRIVVDQLPGGPPIVAKYPPGQFSTDPVVGLVEASVTAARDDAEVPGNLDPSLLDVRDDKPDVGACEYFKWPSVRGLCERGDPDGSRTLVLIGDSHARQWIPALDKLGAELGYRNYYLVREGCPGADVTPLQSQGRGPSKSCERFQDWAVKQLADLHPDVVLLASQGNPTGFATDDGRTVTDDDGIAEELRKGMERQILRVSAPGRRVVVVGDPPALEEDPGTCLSERGSNLGTCAWAPEPRSLLMIDALRQAARSQDVQFVETGSWFCADDLCPAVIGQFIAHRDPTHVSTDYSAYLADELEKQLRLDDPDGSGSEGTVGALGRP